MTRSKVLASSAGVLALLAWLWLVVALPFLTDASCHFLIGFALAGSWLLLGFIWICFLLSAPDVLRFRSARRWWVLAGSAGCLGLFLAFTKVGLILRIALCETSLSHYASQVMVDGRDFVHAPQRVGLFWIDGEESYQDVVFLYTSQAFLNREGVAYVPPGTTPPEHIPRRYLKHLYGPWYWCCWHF